MGILLGQGTAAAYRMAFITSICSGPEPIDTVAASLATAYAELEASADSCLAYREEDQSAHLAAARAAMAQAGAALRPYQMVP
jgi:hypothetical protein